MVNLSPQHTMTRTYYNTPLMFGKVARFILIFPNIQLMMVLKIQMDGKICIVFYDYKHKFLALTSCQMVVLPKANLINAEYVAVEVFCTLTKITSWLIVIEVLH